MNLKEITDIVRNELTKRMACTYDEVGVINAIARDGIDEFKITIERVG